MNDQLLAAVSQYGRRPFRNRDIAAVGVPLPSRSSDCAGSMIRKAHEPLVGYWRGWRRFHLGDQAATPSRWGGPALVSKIGGCSEARQPACHGSRAKTCVPRIYIPAGCSVPGTWVNLASGTAAYRGIDFSLGLLGEMTGAALYISLGRFFSDRVMALYAFWRLTWDAHAGGIFSDGWCASGARHGNRRHGPQDHIRGNR